MSNNSIPNAVYTNICTYAHIHWQRTNINSHVTSTTSTRGSRHSKLYVSMWRIAMWDWGLEIGKLPYYLAQPQRRWCVRTRSHTLPCGRLSEFIKVCFLYTYLHLMSRAHTDTHASLVFHSAESKRLGNIIIQMGLSHRNPPAFAVFAGTLHPWTLMDSLIKRMEEPNTPALTSRKDHSC